MMNKDQIDAIWESLPGLTIIKDKPQDQWNRLLRHEFAAAIIAASDPNKQLVAALTEMVSWFGRYPEFVPVPEASNNVKASINKARAALVAAGEVQS